MHLISLVLIIFFSVFEVQAQIIRPFLKGEQVREYNQLVKPRNLVGKMIEFSNGHRFQIEKMLGKGGTTYIYQVKKVLPADDSKSSYALRIPISNELVYEKLPIKNYINYTIDGHEQLQKLRVPTPKMYEYLEDQYVLMQIIPHDFNLHDFFTNKQNLPSHMLRDAEIALYDFAKQTAHVSFIEDFYPLQLTYSSKLKKWILLDWSSRASEMLYKDTVSPDRIFDSQFFAQFKYVRTSSGAPKLNWMRFFDKENRLETRKITPREEHIMQEITRVVDERRKELLSTSHCFKRQFKKILFQK